MLGSSKTQARGVAFVCTVVMTAGAAVGISGRAIPFAGASTLTGLPQVQVQPVQGLTGAAAATIDPPPDNPDGPDPVWADPPNTPVDPVPADASLR